MGVKNFYNLAFGDKNPTGIIDDLVVTNNGDVQKVLATVVAAIFEFFIHYPDAWVYAIGSTPSRTRLYSISINKYFSSIEMDFDLFGQKELSWEVFVPGVNYSSFLICKKS